jgi:hypothetical protein
MKNDIKNYEIKNMNNIDKQYQTLLQDILDNGIEKKTEQVWKDTLTRIISRTLKMTITL